MKLFDQLTAKEKADLFYTQERLEGELMEVLRSRQEPNGYGLSLKDIANRIKKELSKVEIKSLKEML